MDVNDTNNNKSEVLTESKVAAKQEIIKVESTVETKLDNPENKISKENSDKPLSQSGSNITSENVSSNFQERPVNESKIPTFQQPIKPKWKSTNDEKIASYQTVKKLNYKSFDRVFGEKTDSSGNTAIPRRCAVRKPGEESYNSIFGVEGVPEVPKAPTSKSRPMTPVQKMQNDSYNRVFGDRNVRVKESRSRGLPETETDHLLGASLKLETIPETVQKGRPMTAGKQREHQSYTRLFGEKDKQESSRKPETVHTHDRLFGHYKDPRPSSCAGNRPSQDKIKESQRPTTGNREKSFDRLFGDLPEKQRQQRTSNSFTTTMFNERVERKPLAKSPIDMTMNFLSNDMTYDNVTGQEMIRKARNLNNPVTGDGYFQPEVRERKKPVDTNPLTGAGYASEPDRYRRARVETNPLTGLGYKYPEERQQKKSLEKNPLTLSGYNESEFVPYAMKNSKNTNYN